MWIAGSIMYVCLVDLEVIEEKVKIWVIDQIAEKKKESKWRGFLRFGMF